MLGITLVAWALIDAPQLGLWTGLVQWLPIILLAQTLRSTKSLGFTLLAGILLGAIVIVVQHLFWGSMAADLIAEAMLRMGDVGQDEQELLERNIQLMQLFVLAMVAMIYLFIMLILLVARWMQASLAESTGFADEFRGLALGRSAAAAALVIMVAGFWLQLPWLVSLAFLAIIAFMFQGIAVVHCKLGPRRQARLLLGLFFISVGASIDLKMILSEPVLITGLVFGLMALKFFVLFVLGRVFKLQLADNLTFSLVLAQGGEFAFLLVSFALQSSALNVEIANRLIMVVVLSMVLTPLVIIVFEKLIQPRLMASCGEREHDEIDNADNPVIIAGYGRFGQVVSRLLKASGHESTLLDHDAGQIELTGRFGSKVFYGDAANGELLKSAGAGRARLLVIAIDDPEKALSMIQIAHMHFPGLKILVRAFDRTHAYELIHAGADFIARETFGSALAMGEEALKLLGHTEDRASRMAAKFDKHDTEGMHRLSEVWGDDHEYGLHIRQNLEDLERVLQEDMETSES